MRVDQLLRSSPVDVWLLQEYGKFRKAMAKDETSLYRGVAEQLYPCQNYHEKVKAKCLKYFTDGNSEKAESDFEALSELEKLNVVANAFDRNILLFRKARITPVSIGKFGGTRTPIVLRLTEDGFYEAILDLSHMEAAAFCQSIVYEILYEKVFGFDHEQVMETVDNVRKKRYNGNLQPGVRYQPNTSSSSSDERPSPTSSPNKESWDSELSYPPFPFRVAKSLDPEFYRNAQYDIWLDQKKEDSQQIKPGDKVTVKLETDTEQFYRGHVQEVSPDNGPICVFVEELGQRITVPCETLMRIPTSYSKTPLKKYRRPLATRHTRDSWSDEKVGSSPDSGCGSGPPVISLVGRQRSSTVSSMSPPCPQISYGGSPPLRYTQTPPQPSWMSGYGPPPSTQNQYMPMQQPQMMYGPPIPQQAQYIAGPPPQMPSPVGISSMPPPPHYGQPYYSEPYQGDNNIYGIPNEYISVPQPASGNGQVAPGGLVVVTEPVQCGPPSVPLPSPYNTPVHGPNAPPPGMMPGVSLQVPFLETIQVNAVNYQSMPSSDMQGRDLPHADVNTLRFFFNLGCESYNTAIYGKMSYSCGPPPPSPVSPSIMQQMCANQR